jgi:hypothetical protein
MWVDGLVADTGYSYACFDGVAADSVLVVAAAAAAAAAVAAAAVVVVAAAAAAIGSAVADSVIQSSLPL